MSTVYKFLYKTLKTYKCRQHNRNQPYWPDNPPSTTPTCEPTQYISNIPQNNSKVPESRPHPNPKHELSAHINDGKRVNAS